MEKHVAVVLPHPDDETFGCAGTIALYRAQGVPVTVICGTLGQMGRNMGKPFFATRESLPAVREKELREACKVLDVTDLRLLGLRDKTIEFEDREALADRIAAILTEIGATLVITHYPGHGVHPDHDALGAATVRAVEKMAAQSRPRLRCMAITRNRVEALGEATEKVDISSVSETKLNAIRAHRSQSEAMLANMDKEYADNPYGREQLERFFKHELFWEYRV